MYILADIKWNCENSRFIYEQRRLLKKIFKQKIRIFLFKRFYVCKMYKLWNKIFKKKVWLTYLLSYLLTEKVIHIINQQIYPIFKIWETVKQHMQLDNFEPWKKSAKATMNLFITFILFMCSYCYMLRNTNL